MKKMFILATLFTVFASVSSAIEGKEGGGGDLCESRIQNIRDDIISWINRGGHKSLKLNELSIDDYATRMRTSFAIAKIRCVQHGERGYPVEVNGTPKECRFDIDHKNKKALITCDKQKFEARSENDQYRLIHHEFAGIAGVESPDGDVSSYNISNQLTDYLVNTIVKKLAVKDLTATAWYRLSKAEADIVGRGLQDAFQRVTFRDCNLKLEPMYSGKELTIKVDLIPINESTAGFMNLYVGLSDNIPEASEAVVYLMKRQDSPAINQVFDRWVALETPEEKQKELRVDMVTYLNSSETGIAKVEVVKSKYITYNAGTISTPNWQTRIEKIRSIVCNAK